MTICAGVCVTVMSVSVYVTVIRVAVYVRVYEVGKGKVLLMRIQQNCQKQKKQNKKKAKINTLKNRCVAVLTDLHWS